MGPPSDMRSVVDRNVVMPRIPLVVLPYCRLREEIHFFEAMISSPCRKLTKMFTFFLYLYYLFNDALSN